MRRTPKSPREGIYVLLVVNGKKFWSPIRFSAERPLERDEDGKAWATVQLPAVEPDEQG